jgi:hypothetical protein
MQGAHLNKHPPRAQPLDPGALLLGELVVRRFDLDQPRLAVRIERPRSPRRSRQRLLLGGNACTRRSRQRLLLGGRLSALPHDQVGHPAPPARVVFTEGFTDRRDRRASEAACELGQVLNTTLLPLVPVDAAAARAPM